MNAKKLKKAREARKLSQAQLGELCGGITRSAICKIESGLREPSLALLKRICEVLEINVSDVI